MPADPGVGARTAAAGAANTEPVRARPRAMATSRLRAITQETYGTTGGDEPLEDYSVAWRARALHHGDDAGSRPGAPREEARRVHHCPRPARRPNPSHRMEHLHRCLTTPRTTPQSFLTPASTCR